MKVTGFYKLDTNYINIINQQLGGKYSDNKTRPVYCCLQDDYNENIFWAIPTTSMEPNRLARAKKFCTYPSNDIRSAYYHIGHTNKPAIFKISNALPVTMKYVNEYMSNNAHLKLHNVSAIHDIESKLSLILAVEKQHPNKFEQHITDIYNYLDKLYPPPIKPT